MNQVVLSGGVGFCNAVRRALLSEIESWAVHQVEVRKNTSCQNDEFLAHRIGQLSFRKVGEGTSLQLHVASRTVLARDITGRAFEVVHPDIEIMYLAPGQEIEMTLFLDKQPAKAHRALLPLRRRRHG